MKNIILLLFATIILFSCEKNNEIQNIEQNEIVLPDGVQLIDNTLVFNNQEVYENTIQSLSNYTTEELTEWNINLGFNSYLISYKNSITWSNKLEDDLFAALINNESEIVIDNQLFKVDFEKEVTLQKVVDASDCESLKLSKSDLNNFVAQSWDSDINGESLNSKGVEKWWQDDGYCRENKEKYKDWEFAKHITIPNYYTKLQAKVCFQRFTIYNSIIIKFKAIEKGGDAPNISASYATVGENFYWQKDAPTEHTFDRDNSTIFMGSGNEISHRPYQSSVRLKAYFVSVKFQFDCIGYNAYIPPHGEATLTIQCD